LNGFQIPPLYGLYLLNQFNPEIVHSFSFFAASFCPPVHFVITICRFLSLGYFPPALFPMLSRPRRAQFYFNAIFLLLLAEPPLWNAVDEVIAAEFKFPCELSVLMPIYNKAAYLNVSINSIAALPIDPERICTFCYDDASSDESVEIIKTRQRTMSRLFLIRGTTNRGTLHARIRLVEAAPTPWIVFLDPDDEFTGSGVREALNLIKSTGSDIVQFGCRMATRNQKPNSGCWREPSGVSVLDRIGLRMRWVNGQVDVNMHRKVWRTDLFQRAIRGMGDFRELRILRLEDTLLYGFVLLNMAGSYRYIKTVGEIRRFGWKDNSQSERYQPKEESWRQGSFVKNWTLRVFGKSV
jgi:glycosyltransferase involved in cell wall biosynthesis